MRVRLEQFVAGALAEKDFASFQRNNKQQTAQQLEKIIEVQLHMAKLGEKGKICTPISLTTLVKNAIINWNGIEVSLGLLDKLVRQVRLYPDAAVGIEWEFGEN